MSLAREMSRGFFLNARLGVKGSQNASRSFGTSTARGVAAGLAAVAGGIRGTLLGNDRLPRTMAAAPVFVQFSLSFPYPNSAPWFSRPEGALPFEGARPPG